MGSVTDFSKQPPHEEGRKEKVNSLQWGGSNQKWKQLIPYTAGVIMGSAVSTLGRSLITEGCFLFPSFPLREGAVSLESVTDPISDLD